MASPGWAWTADDGREYIYFHSRHPELAGLSNFAVLTVPLTLGSGDDGREYRTAEHAFQSAKLLRFGRVSEAGRVASAATPAGAKTRGGKRLACLTPEEVEAWEACSVDVMRDVATAKFAVKPDLARLLLDTVDAVLVERLPRFGDKKWGVSERACTGQNLLGVVLMEVRDRHPSG